MENPSSPLDTLRQLKEMLDSGALTPTEFEALKQRLLFNNAALNNPPAAAEPSASATTAAPPEPAPLAGAPAAAPEALPSVPPAWVDSAAAYTQPITVTKVSVTPTDAAPPAAPVSDFVPDSATLPAGVPPVAPFPAAPAARPVPPPVSTSHTIPPTIPYTAPEASGPVSPTVADSDEFAGLDESELPKKNPLALILALGGLLAFLAVVAYLSFNRHPSERLTSTSQTTADSVAAPVEVGPQAEQPAALPAQPETVRVAPARPAPPIVQRPLTPPTADSATTPAPAPIVSDSTTGQ